MSIKSVLLAGAGGNLGPAILNELIAAKKFEISVLSRPESKSTFPPSVTVHKTDYSPASLNAILSTSKFDAVVSTLSVVSPGVGASQINLIDAAKANGVKRFIPSEFGSDTINSQVATVVPIFGPKLNAVAHLRSLESDEFTWTAIITGAFLDWGIRVNFLAVDNKAKKLFKWDDGSVPFSLTNLLTVGKAVASLLGDSSKLSATSNKYIYIASHTITLNQYIEAVKKATPGQEWTIEEVDSEATLKKASEEFKAGNHFAAYDLLKVITFGKRQLGAYDNRLSNELLGLEKEDLVSDIKAALTPATK
ncbi:hypothetical protein CPB83DRAFT_942539 [Crepidotus variabilis]|uniref:NmrA-like domain-containing protein n=1 Tax=Crepidotus variabilis TaxID=179855 RepID=A0A9P6EQQ9_9AGAR|nr:hypothetical protein CPB83DRAFT_942539 [Crepidotus variabilis]